MVENCQKLGFKKVLDCSYWAETRPMTRTMRGLITLMTTQHLWRILSDGFIWWLYNCVCAWVAPTMQRLREWRSAKFPQDQYWKTHTGRKGTSTADNRCLLWVVQRVLHSCLAQLGGPRISSVIAGELKATAFIKQTDTPNRLTTAPNSPAI